MDNSTFTHLYAEQKQPLSRYIYTILKDIQLTEDVIQETFSRLYQQEPEKVQGHEVPWLFTVARNISFKIRSKNVKLVELEPQTEDSLVAEEKAPDEETDLTFCSEKLHEAFSVLTPYEQSVIRLRFFEDLSYKQIALETETTVDSVSFYIHNAKNKLRKVLKKKINN